MEDHELFLFFENTPAAGGSPQTVALGQASETDTSRALTATSALAQAVGRASETDSARALAVATALSVAISRATSTEESRALTAALANAIGVGRASESDEARGLVLPQSVAIGRASETGEARGVTGLLEAESEPEITLPSVTLGGSAGGASAHSRARTFGPTNAIRFPSRAEEVARKAERNRRAAMAVLAVAIASDDYDF